MIITIITHRNFNKDYKHMPDKIKNAFKNRRDLFLENQYNDILNNHKLHSIYEGCRSINITGDIRAIYHQKENEFTFLRIGNHSELYE